ncbi:MAG TPA: phage holin family protein [Candidatus Acidoferrum sp.]|nr:phage holin family protein [Candidatus Acidoferrum sp.]
MSRGAGELRRAVRHACRRAALIAAGIALALMGAGFLLAGGFMALAALVGNLDACLIVGGTLALIGGTFLVFAGRRRRRPAASSEYGSNQSASLATALLGVGHDLGSAASRHPGSLVTAAFLVGLVLGTRR